LGAQAGLLIYGCIGYYSPSSSVPRPPFIIIQNKREERRGEGMASLQTIYCEHFHTPKRPTQFTQPSRPTGLCTSHHTHISMFDQRMDGFREVAVSKCNACTDCFKHCRCSQCCSVWCGDCSSCSSTSCKAGCIGLFFCCSLNCWYYVLIVGMFLR
jgi:hypothetical protein